MPPSSKPVLLRSCQSLALLRHRSLLPHASLCRSSSSTILKPHLSWPAQDLPFQQPDRQKPHPKSESWIAPQSLHKTLEQHREANREGRAVDGIPVKDDRGVKKRNKGFVSPIHPEDHVLLHPPSRRLVLDSIKETLTSVEYGGDVPSLVSSWKPASRLPQKLQFPWIYELNRRPGIRYNVPALQRLSDEIMAYSDYMSPTMAEDAAARRVYDEVASMVSTCGKPQGIRVDLVGSRATGLYSPVSDLDLNLSIDKGVESDSKAMLLMVINRHLNHPETKKSNMYRVNYFLKKAKVPIIDCIHIPSSLNFQFQATDSSIESLQLSKAFVAEYPTVRRLFKVLKQILSMRGLTNGSQHGLTSYPLLIMIVTSLKLGKTASDPNAVGAHLLEFLDFFSTIDFYSVAIHYYPPSDESKNALDLLAPDGFEQSHDPVAAQPALRPIIKKARRNDYHMFLQDPADPSNDLGKTARFMKHIQAIFFEARSQIGHAMAMWDQKESHGLEMSKHGQPLLGWCLAGDYSSFEEARRTLRKYDQNSKVT